VFFINNKQNHVVKSIKFDWILTAYVSGSSSVLENSLEDEIAELVQLIIGSLRSNKVQIRRYTAGIRINNEMTDRYRFDLPARLKNYSQLETIPPSSSLFPLPSRDHSTVPSFSPSLALLYPSKLSLNFVSPLNRRNLETRRTVSNPSPLIVVVVLSKSANDGTARTAGKATLR